MLDKNVAAFFDAIRTHELGVVDTAGVNRGSLNCNVGDFDRDIAGIVRVRQKDQVARLVDEANRWSIPLYPFSTGLNWGYGSHLPVRTGGVLLDLSALNRVVAIDEEQGVATIEPGVTQRQLSDELARRSSRYYVDVTGSGADTSILGNALERGIAYGSLRVQQLTGMEILLGDGTQFHTGFGGFPKPVLAGLYRYGLGPDVDGLFFQSNFGIVLEGKIQLTLRPECMIGLSVSISEEKLVQFVDQVADLVRGEYLNGIPHVANRERTLSTLTPLVADQTGRSLNEARHAVSKVVQGDWVLTGAVTGSPAIAKLKVKHIERALGSIGTVFSHALIHPSRRDRFKAWAVERLMTSDQRVVVKAAEAVRGFHYGAPSDGGIRFLLDGKQRSVDESAEGFLLCTPLAPLSGESARILSRVTKEVATRHHARFAMTLNILTDRVLEGVVSMHFSRESKRERDRAHACVDELTDTFAEYGFYPYRINIDQQRRLRGSQVPWSKITSSIKKVLDPNGVIAPGRYFRTDYPDLSGSSALDGASAEAALIKL